MKKILFLFLFLLNKTSFCDDYIHNREILNLPVGADCTWNGVRGVCASVYNCTSAMSDIRRKNYPPICSFDGVKPIICCADCGPGQYIDLTRDVDVAYFKTGQKARDKCLEYFAKLPYLCDRSRVIVSKSLRPEWNCYVVNMDLYVIAGGKNAKRDQYPHMALLGYGTKIKDAQWLCGGSVISERFILTAAHCISSPAVGTVKYARVGILNRSDPLDELQTFRIKNIFAHPEYKSPSKYHDIALLQTGSPIFFSLSVLPACLHLENETDGNAYATGWGALGHRGELAETLQTVNLQMFSEEECRRAFPKHRHLRQGYNHTTQMCYGDRQFPKDTCEGDSGGPLQTIGHLSHCLYTILGVTSYGRSCGFAGNAGMYTRVRHYLPWIESVVWP